MANRRIERLNEQLRREISDVLRRDVRDPRVGTPTVTRVGVTSDLSMARAFVRIGGAEAERQAALEGLEAAAAFVRREIGGRLRMRRVPELRFEIDRTFEHASRIEELLRQVTPSPEDTDRDAAEGSDGLSSREVGDPAEPRDATRRRSRE